VRLGNHVFAEPAALGRLEAILHPLVRADKERFLKTHARRRTRLVVLDVPLLFERGQWREVDATLVVTAPAFVQTQRALRRPGMTMAKLAGIRARQMPDAEKRRRADYVLQTGLSRGQTERALRGFLRTALQIRKNRPLQR
jgi:dephospho-CoA kinase